MNYCTIIFLVLIGTFGCYGLQDRSKGVDRIEMDLMEYFDKNLKNFTGLEPKHQFTLLHDELLGKTNHALVWKGYYSDGKNIVHQKVAIKIIWDERSMNDEIDIFKALNATANEEIEKHGIPRVYYHGTFLAKYYAIAMTLFDGDLDDRYVKEGKNLTTITILSIFKQSVEALKYLNDMNIVHNDLKPQNIFLRGNKVFISDFDLATVNGFQHDGHTRLFATANFFGCRDRHPMDDLESLIYSIWYVAGVPMVRDWESLVTEGMLLNSCTKKEAMVKVLRKFTHLEDPRVYEVMKYICVDEMLSEHTVPNYDKIISTLTSTIIKIKDYSGPVMFEWLKGSKFFRASSRSPKKSVNSSPKK